MNTRMRIACIVAALACPAMADVVLVKDGRPAGCIIIPAETEKGPVLTAAEDLARYMEQMSGAAVPVRRDNEAVEATRILIGHTALAELPLEDVNEANVGFDGFVIRSVPDGVLIAGRIPQGTAHGVYHFAEDVLGIHWFTPEDDGPTIPKQATIAIPAELNETVKPDFAWRSQWWSFQVVAKEHIDKTAPLAKKLERNRNDWWIFNRLAGIDADVFHAYMYMVPSEMFAEHPEYFSYIDYTLVEDRWAPFNRKVIPAGPNGELPAWPRTAGRQVGDHSVQRCLSNPDVVKLSAKWAADQLRQPGKQFASLTANDGPWWCACDNCERMGNRAAQGLKFANQIAAANRAEFPDRGYMMLAYMHTLEPPKNLMADPAVVPVVAPLWQCRMHPISSACPDMVYMRRVFEQWAKIGNGRIAYYPYTTPGPFTFPGPTALAEEIRFVHGLGGMGCIRENQFTPKVNWAMLNWLEMKLLWNTSLDAEKLRRQFIEGYYGKAAADPIERIYIAIEQGAAAALTGKTSPYDTGNGMHEWESGYEPLADTLKQCRPDIDAALTAAAKEQEAFRLRIIRDMETLLGTNHTEF